MMAKLLYVVHRYAPFPGGSEEYVKNMAEESLKRGHDVTVLTHEHAGDLNGVKVTSDYNILTDPKWSLIIVHGGGCVSQDIVHINAHEIPSPVLYLIIKPSNDLNCLYGLARHRFLGYSTAEDWEYLNESGQTIEGRARRVTHGINVADSIAHAPKTIPQKYFMSAGGFWPHKGFSRLSQTFAAARPDDYLFLFGYSSHPCPEGPNVVAVRGAKRSEVINAMVGAQAYILNSTEEGFGLVLLEAMINKTPWIARHIAGAVILEDFGTTYDTEEELAEILKTYDPTDPKIRKQVERGYDHVLKYHTIENTVNDVTAVLEEVKVCNDIR